MANMRVPPMTKGLRHIDRIKHLDKQVTERDKRIKALEKVCHQALIAIGKQGDREAVERIGKHGGDSANFKEMFVRIHGVDVEKNSVVGGEDMLIEAIRLEHKRIVKNLKKDIDNPESLLNNAKARLRWIEGTHEESCHANTDKDHFRVANSDLYEHEIFNLSALLKHVDWDKQCLLFGGW